MSTNTSGLSPNVVREVFGEDILLHAQAIAAYAFESSPRKPDAKPTTNAERLASLEKYGKEERSFVSFSGDRAQATAVLLNMTENVRGKVMRMASLPAGRRQGHVRDIFRMMFEEMREAGQVVSTLYPFRESFYERLGYATMPRTRFVSFDPANLAELVRLEKPGQQRVRAVEQRTVDTRSDGTTGHSRSRRAASQMSTFRSRTSRRLSTAAMSRLSSGIADGERPIRRPTRPCGRSSRRCSRSSTRGSETIASTLVS